MSIHDQIKKYYFIIGLLGLLAAGLGICLHLKPLAAYNVSGWEQLAWLLLVGLLAGIFGGLLGLGGGAIMLPAMDFWMGFSSPDAIGTTIFAVIFTVLSGAHGHHIRHNTKKGVSFNISAGGIAGILIGSWIFTLMVSKVEILNLCMGLFFLLPAYTMTADGIRRKNESHTENSRDTLAARLGLSDKNWLRGLGFLVGMITGTLGLGGGFLLVPGICYGIGLSVHLAVGSTMLAAVPITIAGSLVKLWQGYVILPVAIVMAIGTVIGAQIGAAFIKYLQPWTLKLIFGLYFFYVAAKYITGFFFGGV